MWITKNVTVFIRLQLWIILTDFFKVFNRFNRERMCIIRVLTLRQHTWKRKM